MGGPRLGGDELERIALGPDDDIDLARAALLLARDFDDSCNVEESLDELERLARPLRGSIGSDTPVLQAALALSAFLGARERFRGNSDDYHDPANSFLHEVLRRRLGIPITLSLLYMEVARRCGVATHGIGVPGHFLIGVQGRVPEPAKGAPRLGLVMVDPFDGGRLLDTKGIAAILARTMGPSARLLPEMLRPVTRRALLARMLHNLRTIYTRRGDRVRTLSALSRLVVLTPSALDVRRDRGMLLKEMGAPVAAREDLEAYLAGSPKAPDVPTIKAAVASLNRRPTTVN